MSVNLRRCLLIFLVLHVSDIVPTEAESGGDMGQDNTERRECSS